MSTAKDVTLKKGDLRHRLKFVSINDSNVRDALGGTVEEPDTEVTTVWGQVKPAIREEVFETGQIVGVITHNIKVRARNSVLRDEDLIKLNIIFGTRRFRILASIVLAERDAVIQIKAQEIQADS